MKTVKLSPKNCKFNCAGCGMLFAPDPAQCPVEVFDDWKLGRDLDQEQYDLIQQRKYGGYAFYPIIQ